MITRSEYMAGEATHQAYYGQFGRLLIHTVVTHIGRDNIAASDDPHFNDIPLKKWDALQPAVMATCGRSLRDANGNAGVSLSDCVCVLKAAAHIIRTAERAKVTP